jgi:colanic acid/amylovoran biosynthesis glycosyltransferase
LTDVRYGVIGLELGRRSELSATSTREFAQQIAQSHLVVGYGYGSYELCREFNVPYVACVEYDLGTQLTVASTTSRSLLRRARASLRCLADYYRTMVPAMRGAVEVHCNGYPIYEGSAPYNPNRLLYLDSRITDEMLIRPDELEARLARRPPHKLRLIFSGRFEPMKGAEDAVRSAMLCLERGLDVELDCYGMGSLAARMKDLASRSGGKIRIHEPIPFPALVEVTKEADLFVCCHIQSDPSCTYLEVMGCGVPVVGYANRMWDAMQKTSNAGTAVRMGSPKGVCDAVADFMATPATLNTAARNARAFASAHTFEKEFYKRTAAMNRCLAAAGETRRS